MIAVDSRRDDVRPTDTVAFAPVDLDEAPAVDALLRRLELGPFDRDGLAVPTGRNDVWAGSTASGEKVVVKRLSGEPEDIAARLGHSLAFERFVDGLPAGRLSVPAYLGADTESGLIAHRMLPDVRTGAELMVDEIFDESTARIAGSLVGTLHDSSAPNSSELWTTPPHWPSAHMLVGISDRLFDQLSFAELEGWRLLQSDDELRAAVSDLVAGEPDGPSVPVHCDLRVDQFLLAPDALHLSDRDTEHDGERERVLRRHQQCHDDTADAGARDPGSRSHPAHRPTRHHRDHPRSRPEHGPPIQDSQTHITILK